MEFEEFKKKVQVSLRLDLNSYKEKQLKRRLDSYLSRHKLNNYGALYDRLVADRRAYENFVDYLTINVSEFFRDARLFEELQKKYIPQLSAARSRLKVWSAACSNGAEPYSVAIIMDELGLTGRYEITATDIDEQILNKARLARYTAESLKNVSSARLQRFFDRDGDVFIFKAPYKNKVVFKRHDLLAGNYETGCDLILCRNVTIYFTKEAQNGIYRRFYQAMNPGGILFIGGSEMIFNYRELGFNKLSTCFYQKVIN